jgi:peptidoglycan/LPS O-acetylase OafA/YrhL
MYDRLSLIDTLRSIVFIPLALTDVHEAPFFGGSALHVGWTLNFEVYFYLVFFASLFFKRLRWIAFIAWMVLILVVLPITLRDGVSFDIRHHYSWGKIPYLNLMTSCLIWEFIIGVALGHLYLRGLRFKSATTAWIATVVVVSFVIWAVYNGVAAKFGQLGYGIVYGVLLLVLLAADKTLEFKVWRWLVWLGNISFSLYLIHPTVVENVAIPLLQINSLHPSLKGFPYVIFLSMLSLCLAYPFHIFVERRMSNLLRDSLLRLRRRGASEKTPMGAPGTAD